jgi:hypothetical protein
MRRIIAATAAAAALLAASPAQAIPPLCFYTGKVLAELGCEEGGN